ncbi:MAG: glycogen synthase [Mycobacteriales bacterium]
MHIGLLTREFPPDVYGGAGVHVEYLSQHLRALADVQVHCFGAPRDGAIAHEVPADLVDANPALATLGVDLAMAAALAGCDVVHSHTWYANLGGYLAAMLYDVPHVVTAHSLEPQRPWKAEQLGGGYRISSWAERTAYEAASAIIAVSAGMRADVLASYPSIAPDRVHVVPNGIDSDYYRRVTTTGTLQRYGVDPDRPTVVFIGRITRQKGVDLLLRAAARFDPAAQLVLAAGAPDTPEIAASTRSAVDALRARRDGVIWIEEMLGKAQVIELLSHATVFCCPSIYEPQGIVNLEAMACETAVVATRVGGIPEVVVDGETGLLVDLDGRADEAMAAAVNRLIGDPARARAMGTAGRERAVTAYGWDAIARRTLAVYEGVSRPA